MTQQGAEVARVVPAISEVDPAAWDGLLTPASTPFMRHAFLLALEESGAVDPGEGWSPRHLTLWRDGRLVAASPAYVRTESMGDFSRDWGLAGVFQRAGVPYYPKLVVGVPFSPVTGQRLLTGPGEDRPALISRLAALMGEVVEEERLQSVQVLFCQEDEGAALRGLGFAERLGLQLHWQNRGYPDREAFLGTFRSKDRTRMKREWRAPADHGITVRTVEGAELKADSASWVPRTYRFYASTVTQYMWRTPYLNPAFFQRIFDTMPEHLQVVAATAPDGRFLAGAFNVCDGATLWGRYWGCEEHVPLLHFNVCFYHSIDECIRRGIQTFEGGEGGEHKAARGFAPVATRACFRFVHRGLHTSVGRWMEEDRLATLAELARFQEGARR